MFPELTVVEIARRVAHAPLHRVECVLWTRPHVRPPVLPWQCGTLSGARSAIHRQRVAADRRRRRGGSLQG